MREDTAGGGVEQAAISDGKRMNPMVSTDDRWQISEVLSLHGHIFDGAHLDP